MKRVLRLFMLMANAFAILLAILVAISWMHSNSRFDVITISLWPKPVLPVESPYYNESFVANTYTIFSASGKVRFLHVGNRAVFNKRMLNVQSVPVGELQGFDVLAEDKDFRATFRMPGGYFYDNRIVMSYWLICSVSTCVATCCSWVLFIGRSNIKFGFWKQEKAVHN